MEAETYPIEQRSICSRRNQIGGIRDFPSRNEVLYRISHGLKTSGVGQTETMKKSEERGNTTAGGSCFGNHDPVGSLRVSEPKFGNSVARRVENRTQGERDGGGQKSQVAHVGRRSDGTSCVDTSGQRGPAR